MASQVDRPKWTTLTCRLCRPLRVGGAAAGCRAAVGETTKQSPLLFLFPGNSEALFSAYSRRKLFLDWAVEGVLPEVCQVSLSPC